MSDTLLSNVFQTLIVGLAYVAHHDSTGLIILPQMTENLL